MKKLTQYIKNWEDLTTQEQEEKEMETYAKALKLIHELREEGEEMKKLYKENKDKVTKTRFLNALHNLKRPHVNEEKTIINFEKFMLYRDGKDYETAMITEDIIRKYILEKINE